MGWNHANDPGPLPARERRSGETEAEHAFWLRCKDSATVLMGLEVFSI
jgi:hypothetical protein